jgi:hypothetical protein
MRTTSGEAERHCGVASGLDTTESLPVVRSLLPFRGPGDVTKGNGRESLGNLEREGIKSMEGKNLDELAAVGVPVRQGTKRR